MFDWRTLEKKVIFEGKDKKGNRYLTQFLQDYKREFNPQDINAGCSRCLNDYYLKTIKYLNTMSKKDNEKKCDYTLKPMFHGIPLKFGSPTLCTNQNLTNEMAEELIKTHPLGEKLFLDKAVQPKPFAGLVPEFEKGLPGMEERNKFAETNGITVVGTGKNGNVKKADYEKAFKDWADKKAKGTSETVSNEEE